MRFFTLDIQSYIRRFGVFGIFFQGPKCRIFLGVGDGCLQVSMFTDNIVIIKISFLEAGFGFSPWRIIPLSTWLIINHGDRCCPLYSWGCGCSLPNGRTSQFFMAQKTKGVILTILTIPGSPSSKWWEPPPNVAPLQQTPAVLNATAEPCRRNGEVDSWCHFFAAQKWC